MKIVRRSFSLAYPVATAYVLAGLVALAILFAVGGR